MLMAAGSTMAVAVSIEVAGIAAVTTAQEVAGL